MELISVPKILPASPNFTDLCLHRKSENVCDQESYKVTTKGQRPWLGIHRIFMGRILAELSSWTVSLLLFPHMSPARCGFMSAARVSDHGSLHKWKAVHGPQGAMLHMVLSLEMRKELWPGWGLAWGWKRASGFWSSQEDCAPSVKMEFIPSTQR